MFIDGCLDQSVSGHRAHYVHCEDLQAGDLNQSFVQRARCGGKESRWNKVRQIERRGSSDQKWKKRRGTLIDSCLAWCLPRLFPPSSAIISRRTSPSPWQATVSPLSPGGCYPIWEEMNRSPLTPYEVSVDRESTVVYSKQALFEHQHPQHLRKKNRPPHQKLGPQTRTLFKCLKIFILQNTSK